MQIVRKLFVKVAKSVIGIVPKSWVKWLKQHPQLVAAYSRNLHKSGLLYQLQTVEELTRAYRAYQCRQQNQFELLYGVGSESTLPEEIIVPQTALLICIVNFEPESLSRTLKSAMAQTVGFSRFFIWCHHQDLTRVQGHLDTQKVSHCDVISDIRLIRFDDKEPALACFIVFAGDIISPYLNRALLNSNVKSARVAYIDNDTWLNDGNTNFPDFKPDWNPDLQLTAGYVHSGIWLANLNDFVATNPQLTSACICIFLCEFYLRTEGGRVEHIPLVLLSCPKAKDSFTAYCGLMAPLYNEVAEMVPTSSSIYSLRWRLPSDMPLVSIIIPTRNGLALVKACIESILGKTTYQNYEIVLVDNGSNDEACLAYFAELDQNPVIRVLSYDKKFNYSAINNFAVKHANGQVLAFVNNDIEVINGDWLTYMVGHAMRSDIGCVGAKLLYSDLRVQHAGVVMGYGGGAGHAHKYFPSDHAGYMNRLAASHNFSAVTGACLVVKKGLFKSVGGFNEQNLAIAFNDVDLCLKVLKLGVRNLYCAEAILYHHESVSRGHEDTPEKMRRFQAELQYLRDTWGHYIDADPAYNVNLTRSRENFAIRPVDN